MRPVDSLDFPQRLRRTLDHQQAMQSSVYDDEHRAGALKAIRDGCAGRPGVTGGLGRASARAICDARRNRADWTELRYHHLVPSPEDWRAILARRPLAGPAPCDADHRFQFL